MISRHPVSGLLAMRQFAMCLWPGCFAFCLLVIAHTAQADNSEAGNNRHEDSVMTGRVNQSRPVKAVPVENRTADHHQEPDDHGPVLTSEQWDAARTAETVTQLTAVRTVVNAWLMDRSQQIEIRYPGGEEGEFWVQELTDWLISLGIPSDKLIRSPGSGAADVIRLQLSRAG